MDMSTTYLGLKLRSPIVPSASPLSQNLDRLRQMEDAGAGAVVLWSLFEEQISHDAEELDFYQNYGTERFAESLTYFPPPRHYKFASDQYLEHITKCRQAVEIPIIASLNGVSTGGWESYAKQIQQAGASALELNVYYVSTDPGQTSQQVEEMYLSAVKAVRAAVTIPVAVKLSPFFTAIPNMAASLAAAGANGLVLFNRFYQPEIDLSNLEVVPCHVLSTSADNHLAMRWIAILYGRLNASLAATNGIHSSEDVAKLLLAGADVTMMCSALLQEGIGHIHTVLEGLRDIMQHKGYESVREMKGALSQQSCPEPAAFERANYIKSLSSYAEWGVATLE